MRPLILFALTACATADKASDGTSPQHSGLATDGTTSTSTYVTTSDPTTTTMTIGAVDVLFVIDDSNSMPPYQASFAAAVGELVDGLAAHDPRFGVITTSSPALVGGDVVTSAELTTLQGRLEPGSGGEDQEQGLRWAVAALVDPAWRPDAHMLLVALSDEEDCSHDGALDGQPASECYTEPQLLTPVADLVAALEAARPSSSLHAFVLGSTTTTGCEGFPSARWAEAASLTGGGTHPLCSAPFASSFALVAQAL